LSKRNKVLEKLIIAQLVKKLHVIYGTPPSSALKVEAICSSEILVSAYISHGTTIQKTSIDIIIAVRTSSLML
jgi:hypothetical protein